MAEENLLTKSDRNNNALTYLRPEEDEPYFAAIGKFIVEYARAEAAFHVLAHKLLGVESRKSTAILSGMRFPDLVDRIKAMLPLEKVSEKDTGVILGCLTQINAVGTRRHHLVHRWVTYENQKILVTNLFIAKSPELVHDSEMSLDDLKMLRDDCLKIYFRVIRIARPAPKNDSAQFLDWLRSAWQYTPEQPNNPASKPPKTQKSKQRQPRPLKALPQDKRNDS